MKKTMVLLVTVLVLFSLGTAVFAGGEWSPKCYFDGEEPIPAGGIWKLSQREVSTEASTLAKSTTSGTLFFLIGGTERKENIYTYEYEGNVYSYCSVTFDAPVWIFADRKMTKLVAEGTDIFLSLQPRYNGQEFNRAWLSFCIGNDCTYIRLLYTPQMMSGDYTDEVYQAEEGKTKLHFIDGVVTLKRLK